MTTYLKVFGNACTMHKEKWLDREREMVRDFGKDKPLLAKQYQCTSISCHWLQTISNRLNGSQLSAKKFHNNWQLREIVKLIDMPQLCEGCGKQMTDNHSLSWKCDGLVYIWHDDVGRSGSSCQCVSLHEVRYCTNPIFMVQIDTLVEVQILQRRLPQPTN